MTRLFKNVNFCRHRYRMGSPLRRVSNFTFGTTLLVAIPSYYMCCKTKIWNKKVIEEMMAANEFEHESNAPSQPALDDHPFLAKAADGEVSDAGKLDAATKYRQ